MRSAFKSEQIAGSATETVDSATGSEMETTGDCSTSLTVDMVTSDTSHVAFNRTLKCGLPMFQVSVVQEVQDLQKPLISVPASS